MASATSSLYVLDIKGRCLISRDYSGDISTAQADFSKLLEKEVKPLIWVEAQVERHLKSRVVISVKGRSEFKESRSFSFMYYLSEELKNES